MTATELSSLVWANIRMRTIPLDLVEKRVGIVLINSLRDIIVRRSDGMLAAIRQQAESL